ncbi:MAG: tRNA (adenosine(37)-N6)-dimethylallyltransferase MiaA, partial [Clostridia bacterium]|nr:tRNA (adenosine(37)-N6)-dimethylallyltransferase MiaA [Clostridia bacterium]
AVGLRFNDREKLYDRINRRVDIMLENGLLNEAKETMAAESATAAQAIGHKELFPYLKGECSLDEAVENLKRETRRYAKRQITWFSRDERINWIDADDGDFEKIIEKFIKILEKYGKCDIIAK